MDIVLIGLNHRTAPVELRERVAFSRDQARHAAQELCSQQKLGEAVVLSTCNRSELYGVPPGAAKGTAKTMEDFLACYHGVPPGELRGCVYRHRNSDATRHLFRVAAGLDSLLLGEAEILGQVRQAYGVALEHRTTGRVLNRMFQGALQVGKRVRTETDLGTRPMSVAFAGVKLAEKIFGNLRGRRALVLGAGAVSEQVTEHIRERGARLLMANRSRSRSEQLAQRVDGEVVQWDLLAQALKVPDIILSSVGGIDRVLTRPMVERAMNARANRALFVIDLGVPRNIEADVAALYNVYLYNIDDLAGIVELNKKAREAEVPRAEAIVEEHVGRFEAWRAGLQMRRVDKGAELSSVQQQGASERRLFDLAKEEP